MARQIVRCMSIYIPHICVENNVTLNILQELPEPSLLLGDIIARHNLWWEEKDNQKGKIFEEMLIENDIIFLNIIEPTHNHILTDGYTTIDLSIVTSNCCLDFNHKFLSSLHQNIYLLPAVQHTCLCLHIGLKKWFWQSEL